MTMQVFISHANQDREFARKLTGVLSKVGVTVWDPDQEIFPGDNWAKKTGQALEESDLMVAIVTLDALTSGLLQHDVQYALTSTNYRGRVVPVLVDYPSYQDRQDVPWVLFKMDPISIESTNPELDKIAERVRSLAETDCNVAG